MIKDFEYEIRPVVGYEGLYSVSNIGEVFSHNYKRTGQTREMKPLKSNDGYSVVCLFRDKKQKD